MTFEEELDFFISRTANTKYRTLCDPATPHSERWRDIVHQQVAALQGLPEPPPRRIPAVAPDGRLRVGFIASVFSRGGAEGWHGILIPRLDNARIRVTGLALAQASPLENEPLPTIMRNCPVAFGQDAIKSLIATSDALVL